MNFLIALINCNKFSITLIFVMKTISKLFTSILNFIYFLKINKYTKNFKNYNFFVTQEDKISCSADRVKRELP